MDWSKIGMPINDALNNRDLRLSLRERKLSALMIFGITTSPIKMRLWILKSMPEREASKFNYKPQFVP